MNKSIFGLFVFAGCVSAYFSSCDDGRIYAPESELDGSGRTVTFKGEIRGTDDYGTEYSLALAAFEDGNEYAEVSKSIKEDTDEITLSNIGIEKGTVEMCVINRLRKRVITIESVDITESTDEYICHEIAPADCSPFALICDEVFEKKCIQCHGATGTAAAGLNLSRKEAYSMLVGQPSAVEEDKFRVMPGSPEQSTLWEAVGTDTSAAWHYNHSGILSREQSEFIKYWIENL